MPTLAPLAFRLSSPLPDASEDNLCRRLRHRLKEKETLFRNRFAHS
jgi:hypothetical protein